MRHTVPVRPREYDRLAKQGFELRCEWLIAIAIAIAACGGGRPGALPSNRAPEPPVTLEHLLAIYRVCWCPPSCGSGCTLWRCRDEHESPFWLSIRHREGRWIVGGIEIDLGAQRCKVTQPDGMPTIRYTVPDSPSGGTSFDDVVSIAARCAHAPPGSGHVAGRPTNFEEPTVVRLIGGEGDGATSVAFIDVTHTFPLSFQIDLAKKTCR